MSTARPLTPIDFTQSAQTQAATMPADALRSLREGNERFLAGRPLLRNVQAQVRKTAGGQFPIAAVLSCIDSRIPTEMVFDQGIGDIFNARVAGNVVNPEILGSLEFACKIAGAKLIVVMGHTSCGAVKGACDGAELGHLTGLLRHIHSAVESVDAPPGADRSSGNPAFVDAVAKVNVEHSIDAIRARSAVLREMYQMGEIEIVGAMYDVHTGRVDFLPYTR